MKKLIKLRKSLLNYFYYTGSPKKLNPISYLRIFREGFSVLKIKRNYPSLYKSICEIISKSDSRGGEWSDYLNLYEEIILRKPLRILELGSGISSLVICKAIEKNMKETGNPVQFFSIDENDFYHKQIIKIFPKKYLDKVNFILSKREQKEFEGLLGAYYEKLPNLEFDFIFIDGPTGRKGEGSKKCFSADLFNLIRENKIKKVNGLIDQRVWTFWAFKKLLPELNIKYHVLKKMCSFSYEKK